MEQDEFPEEVLDIKWETPMQHKNEFLSEDYVHQNSSTYKILNDTFTKVWSSDSDDDTKKKKPLPRRAAQECKQGLPRRLFRLYKPFTAYPRASHLTINQHKVYLQLMKKFSNRISPYMSKQDQEEFQLYQTLQGKIAAEQIEYLEFLKNFAISNQSRYSSINPDIKMYINELWKVQLQNALKYPRYYTPFRTIGLVLNDSKELLDLIPQDEILKKGRVDILNLNKKKLRIERIYSNFVRRHPIIDQETANKETTTTFNCPVSHDENAELIAQRLKVDFVLSSSSLKCICDNYPPYNKSWGLPVTVKQLKVEDNSHIKKKRIVFIDKALPRKSMTVTDKLILYHKIAIKRLLVNYHHSGPRQVGLDEDHLKKTGEQDVDFLRLDWCDENDLESFGVDGPTCSKSTVERPCGLMENIQLNEKSVTPMEVSDDICASAENSGLSKENDNAEVNSVCVSDSDDEQLVIDDPEAACETENEKKSALFHKPCSKNSREKTSGISGINTVKKLSVENSPKPNTRSMAKMLETLHKVEEIASMKSHNSRENVVATKNIQLDTLDDSKVVGSENISSLNEEVNGVQCENKTSVGGKDSKVKSRSKSLLDDLLEQQKKWFEHERPKSEECHSHPVDITGNMDFLKGYEPIPPPRGGNYVYRLFSLKKKGVPSPGYRLLIRYKNDAREAPPKHRTAVIVPKLEFQPEFGAETTTVSEMTRDWLALRIRPNSFLVRARINAFTSDIMMVEQKECKDFYKDEKYHNLQVSSCLNTLEAVLHGFSDLPYGHYLFTHEAKMGAFGNVFAAHHNPRGGLFDLHEEYKVNVAAEEPQVLSSLWIPIDFSIITPLYEELGRVPGTFIPKNQKKKKRPNKKKKTDSTSAN